MTNFERDDMRSGYSYSDAIWGKAPTWIVGLVAVAMIIGVVAYSGRQTGPQPAATPSAVHETVPTAPAAAPSPAAPAQKP